MILLTVPQMLAWVDEIAIHYDTVQAAMDQGAVSANAFHQEIATSSNTNADFDTPQKMFGSVTKMVAAAPASAFFGGQFRQVISDWNTFLRTVGPAVNAAIINIDGFASYYNGVTPYQCLLPWEFAQIYFWASPGVQLSPGNVYAPGGPVNAAYSYTTAGGIVVNQSIGFQLAHGAISGGVSTFVADNAGAVPSANVISPYVQGYSPVIPELVVGTSFAGTGTVVLTFTGVNQAGAPKTWTVTVVSGGTGLTSGTVVSLTPITGGDRMRSVSAVATSGTVTAGTWTLRVKQETGRPA